MVVYVSQQENGNYDIWIVGRKNNEVNNLPYQTAMSRARDIIRNTGKDGDIIIVKNDETRTVEHVG